jgi:N-carbamoylputrescine amidase
MARIVRSALIQAKWAGNQKAMIDKHVKFIQQAAKKGAQITCVQELFFGPYFCQIEDPKYYSYAETIPGPTTELMQEIAKKHKMVLIVSIYEQEQTGVYYNTAVVIDADGSYLGKYRKTHIPQVKGFWEKFYFRPGNLGYPVFKTRYATIGVYICYDRHFPEGARALGLNGAEIVYIPSATSRGLSMHLWKIEQTSHAIANGYFVGTNNRVGQETEFGANDYYGSSYFADPRGQIIAIASDKEEEVLVADLDLDLIREVRNTWQFYRDRRPEAYGSLVNH